MIDMFLWWEVRLKFWDLGIMMAAIAKSIFKKQFRILVLLFNKETITFIKKIFYVTSNVSVWYWMFQLEKCIYMEDTHQV
jgi:hypothetical protein